MQAVSSITDANLHCARISIIYLALKGIDVPMSNPPETCLLSLRPFSPHVFITTPQTQVRGQTYLLTP
jgi:hypothetical protein